MKIFPEKLTMVTEFRIIIAGLIFLATSSAIGLIIDTIIIHNNQMNMHGAITTSSPICSEHARIILKHGGSALDAAVAASLCVGIVNAHSSGIGGGAFITVRDKSGNVKIFDARETAPAYSNPDLFKNRSQSQKGGLAVAVPGYLMGVFEAHRKYGRLPWKELMGMSIKICEDGVHISQPMEHAMKTKIKFFDMKLSQTLLGIYTTNESEDCCFKTMDDIIKLKLLAETLSEIAFEGIQSFYSGEIAENTISTVRESGGVMNLDDLKNYKVKIKDPLKMTIKGIDIYCVPQPSICLFVPVVLKILENFELVPNDFTKAETYRKILETFRHVYVAVEGFSEVTNNSVVETIMSDNFTTRIYNLVKDTKIDTKLEDDNFSIFDNSVGTSHVSVIDGNGEAVSITSSVNRWFGSLLMTDDGIILNDQMDDFNFPFEKTNNEDNYPLPGRRPRSAMSPIIMTENSTGKIWSVGGTNGTRIVSGIAYVLIHVIYGKMSLESAIKKPRLHILNNLKIYNEKDFSPEILVELREMGYQTVEESEGLSVVNGASLGGIKGEAYGDDRKSGVGYMF